MHAAHFFVLHDAGAEWHLMGAMRCEPHDGFFLILDAAWHFRAFFSREAARAVYHLLR